MKQIKTIFATTFFTCAFLFAFGYCNAQTVNDYNSYDQTFNNERVDTQDTSDEEEMDELEYFETRGDDMQMWQFQVQQEQQKVTQYLTMMSNIAKAWDDAQDSIVNNIK